MRLRGAFPASAPGAGNQGYGKVGIQAAKLVSGTFFRGFAVRLVRASPERKVPDTNFEVASHTLPDFAGTVRWQLFWLQ